MIRAVSQVNKELILQHFTIHEISIAYFCPLKSSHRQFVTSKSISQLVPRTRLYFETYVLPTNEISRE